MAEKLYLFARGSPTRGNNDDRRNPALSAEQTERFNKER